LPVSMMSVLSPIGVATFSCISLSRRRAEGLTDGKISACNNQWLSADIIPPIESVSLRLLS